MIANVLNRPSLDVRQNSAANPLALAALALYTIALRSLILYFMTLWQRTSRGSSQEDWMLELVR
jgi:hypothetical protein